MRRRAQLASSLQAFEGGVFDMKLSLSTLSLWTNWHIGLPFRMRTEESRHQITAVMTLIEAESTYKGGANQMIRQLIYRIVNGASLRPKQSLI